MKNKKIIFLSSLALILGISVSVFAQGQCPSNTQVQATSAILVGEVTDDGGDPNLTVWFEYGLTTDYGSQTIQQSKTGTGLFCAEITGLIPQTTYHYRAVARNSAGTSYGQDKTFTTRALAPTVDLKVNDSDGPVTIPYNGTITLSWNSTDASYCYASWSLISVSPSGTKTISNLKTGNYNYSITCYGAGGSASDSVSVNVQSPPTPIIDFKANNSTYNYLELSLNDYVTLSWNTQYANNCSASGDWSGSKSLSGSQSIKLTSIKLYTFNLTCSNETGESSSTINVYVRPKPPTVITKPAVVTY